MSETRFSEHGSGSKELGSLVATVERLATMVCALDECVRALDERVRALDEHVRELSAPAVEAPLIMTPTLNAGPLPTSVVEAPPAAAPLPSAELTAVKLEDVPLGESGSPALGSLVDLTGGSGKDKKRGSDLLTPYSLRYDWRYSR